MNERTSEFEFQREFYYEKMFVIQKLACYTIINIAIGGGNGKI